jgi:hypothetical protein
MSAHELDAVRGEADALRVAQRTKDDATTLALLPRIDLADLPRQAVDVPTHASTLDGVPMWTHDVFSNGIGYLDLSFDVVDVPERLQPYLPLLASALGGMGAGGEGYESFSRRKAATTGGVSVVLDAWTMVGSGAPAERLTLRVRALDRNLDPALDIVRRIVSDLDLHDRKRLGELLAQSRNRMKAALSPQGHVFAWQTAAAGLRRSRHRVETWRGMPHLRFLDHLLDGFEADPAPVVAALTELVDLVVRRERVIVNLTAGEPTLGAIRDRVPDLVSAIPAGGAVGPPGGPDLVRRRIGVAIPGEVCYVAQVAPVPGYASAEAPTLAALASHLRSEVLYKRIRVEGGAYGAHAIYEATNGLFVMVSYRDPNLLRTLATYARAVDDLLAEPLEPHVVRSTLIGTLGRIDRPMDPATAGYTALRWECVGLGYPQRQRFREGILSLDGDRLREVAEETLRPALADAVSAAYAPRERIDAANADLSAPFEVDD